MPKTCLISVGRIADSLGSKRTSISSSIICMEALYQDMMGSHLDILDDDIRYPLTGRYATFAWIDTIPRPMFRRETTIARPY